MQQDPYRVSLAERWNLPFSDPRLARMTNLDTETEWHMLLYFDEYRAGRRQLHENDLAHRTAQSRRGDAAPAEGSTLVHDVNPLFPNELARPLSPNAKTMDFLAHPDRDTFLAEVERDFAVLDRQEATPADDAFEVVESL